MTQSSLPQERYRLFLAVRRGVPLTLAAGLMALAVVEPAGLAWPRGWLVLAAVAFLGEVWPTFKTGTAYLKARNAIMRWDAGWVWVLRPLFRRLGMEEAWILSFCAWNNHKVRGAFETRKARRTLVLLPHCIQMARCKAEVLTELSNCYECGLCPVGDFLALKLTHDWESRISNRSHKAYREARAYRPDLIVAVSCVDRLFKGLVKMPEVPCYVIPLGLPHRMCVDTTFSVPHLLAAMNTLVEPREGQAEGERIVPFHREGIA
jgi:uncharacterized protein